MSRNLLSDTQIMAKRAGHTIQQGFQKYWLRIALLGMAGFMISKKDIAFDIQLNSASASLVHSAYQEAAAPPGRAVSTSFKSLPPEEVGASVNVSNIANTYSNLTSANKGELKSESNVKHTAKRKKQLKYVKRFKTVAKTEMDKYGIPASITLAQGLLESNVGESKLATHNNNHFGIKCFSKSCSKGHCSNFTDDSHKDFFRKYQSSWESYRAHSLLLKRSSRYKNLFGLRKNDYKAWAYGLKKAGYATDKRYPEKIINLIEDLKLYQYD